MIHACIVYYMNTNGNWLLLITTLPTKPTAARMRLWRGAKALGCAALRDGAWLLPATCAEGLRRLAGEVVAANGSAELLTVAAEGEQAQRFAALFDRGADYGRLLAAIGKAAANPDAKAVPVLRRELQMIAATDFFPGEAQRQAEAALAELAASAGGEPRAGAGKIRRLTATDFRGRTWATREHLWVDRMASAWLIRRFIDKKAKFLWLDNPKKCPKTALGFDFNGAAFTHVGSRVTFEVLAASFGLDTDPAIVRIGTIVHCLDVGGVPVAEAAGIEALLTGLRAAATDDDKLLTEAGRVFDGLYHAYRKESDHE
jgi:hypothetical protein